MSVITYNGYFIPEKKKGTIDYKHISDKAEMIYDKLRRLIFTPRGTDMKDKFYGTNIRKYIQKASTPTIIDSILGEITSAISRYLPEHYSNITVSAEWFKPNLFNKTTVAIKFVINVDVVLVFTAYLSMSSGKLYIN